jgi:predicted TPR repeat methyltransferase
MTRLIVKYYDRVASRYDAATRRKGAWKAPSECAKLLRGRLKAKAVVLDLGVGTGSDLAAITRPQGRVVGLDISRRMLEYARRRLPHARLIVADIEKRLPISRKPTFDLVMAIGILEFVRNLSTVFREAALRLRPGGLICFTYEEQISSHPLQYARRSLRGEGVYQSVPRLLSFPVYRRTWPEVRRLIDMNGLVILGHHRFRAYTLRNSVTHKEYPVVYRVVLVQKP